MMRHAVALCLVLALSSSLSGCAGGAIPRSAGNPGSGAATTAARPAVNTHRAGVLPTRATGAEAIYGRTARDLGRLFGPPRLSSTDGPAHRLQFTGSTCVLDAYLYAPRAGAEPQVTHVDTRSGDGSDADRASCIAALQRR